MAGTRMTTKELQAWLPAVLNAQEKETKVKNLRTALRLRGLDGVVIEVVPTGPSRGPSAVWRIKR